MGRNGKQEIFSNKKVDTISRTEGNNTFNSEFM
jgi:hypothetical protein